MAETTQDTRTPFRVCEDDPVAEWYCPVAADADPDDPWAGWAHITGNARRQTVEVEGVEYTPREARQVANAIRAAADHAEEYGHRAEGFLVHLTSSGHLAAVLDGLPSEQQRTVRDALRRTGDRYRNAYPTKPTS